LTAVYGSDSGDLNWVLMRVFWYFWKWTMHSVFVI
jgi:hypothetical protein